MFLRLTKQFTPAFTGESPADSDAEPLSSVTDNERFLTGLLESTEYKQLHRYLARSLVLKRYLEDRAVKTTTLANSPRQAVMVFFQNLLQEKNGWYQDLVAITTATIPAASPLQNVFYPFLAFNTELQVSLESRQTILKNLLAKIQELSSSIPAAVYSQPYLAGLPHYANAAVATELKSIEHVIGSLTLSEKTDLMHTLRAMLQKEYLALDSLIVPCRIEKFSHAGLQEIVHRLNHLLRAVFYATPEAYTTESGYYGKLMTLIGLVELGIKSHQQSAVLEVTRKLGKAAKNCMLDLGIMKNEEAKNFTIAQVKEKYYQLVTRIENEFADYATQIKSLSLLEQYAIHEFLSNTKIRFWTLLSALVEAAVERFKQKDLNKVAITTEDEATVREILLNFTEQLVTIKHDCQLKNPYLLYDTLQWLWIAKWLTVDAILYKKHQLGLEYTPDTHVTYEFLMMPNTDSLASKIAKEDQWRTCPSRKSQITERQKASMHFNFCIGDFEAVVNAASLHAPKEMSVYESGLSALHDMFITVRRYNISCRYNKSFITEFAFIQFARNALKTIAGSPEESLQYYGFELSRTLGAIIRTLFMFAYQEPFSVDATMVFAVPDRVAKKYWAYYTDVALQEYFLLAAEFLQYYRHVLKQSTFPLHKLLLQELLQKHLAANEFAKFSKEISTDDLWDLAMTCAKKQTEQIVKMHANIIKKLHVKEMFQPISKEEIAKAEQHMQELLQQVEHEATAARLQRNEKVKQFKKRFTKPTVPSFTQGKGLFSDTSAEEKTSSSFSEEARKYKKAFYLRQRSPIDFDKLISLYEDICKTYLAPTPAEAAGSVKEPVDHFYVAAALAELSACHADIAFDMTPADFSAETATSMWKVIKSYNTALEFARKAEDYFLHHILPREEEYMATTSRAQDFEQLSKHIAEKLAEANEKLEWMSAEYHQLELQNEQDMQTSADTRAQAILAFGGMAKWCNNPNPTNYHREKLLQQKTKQADFHKISQYIDGLVAKLKPIHADMNFIAGNEKLPQLTAELHNGANPDLFAEENILHGGGTIFDRLHCLDKTKLLENKGYSRSDVLLRLNGKVTLVGALVPYEPQRLRA